MFLAVVMFDNWMDDASDGRKEFQDDSKDWLLIQSHYFVVATFLLSRGKTVVIGS